MQCPNCQTINPVQAKFCLECGTRLVICPNCQTANLPQAKFCMECGTSLQTDFDTLLSFAPMVESHVVSDALQEYVITPATDELPSLPEERRIVTIMFADITGSTPLAGHLEPEDLRAILAGYFNLMAEQIRKHGGTVEKYIGDAVMAVFGTPVAHEDDPERALRAALDMQTALTKFNEQRLKYDPGATRLQMRMGVNTGEVATPGNQQIQRQDFLITGDAVNIAARLQQTAQPDTIFVGERTYLATRNCECFQFYNAEMLQLRGKDTPILSYRLEGVTNTNPSQKEQMHNGTQIPSAKYFVGRNLELTLLQTTYARVFAENRPHLITILGAPGIGKTQLVREFIKREYTRPGKINSPGVAPLVLHGHCPAYGEGITYWPFYEIVRSLLDTSQDEEMATVHDRFVDLVKRTLTEAESSEPAEEIAHNIARYMGRPLSMEEYKPEYEFTAASNKVAQEAHFTRTATTTKNIKQTSRHMPFLRSWRVFLEALAKKQPVIMVVDDIQWADEALLDLLEYLAERISNVPILFLCPTRPDLLERRRDWGGGKRNFTAIELEVFSQEESNEFINALLPVDDLPEALRNTILVRAEGNPFFVEEIVRMLIDQGIAACKLKHEHNELCWRAGIKPYLLGDMGPTTDEHDANPLFYSHYLFPLPRVPDTIQGVLAARIDLLKPIDKRILQHASVVGRTFWLSSIKELAYDLPIENIMEALHSLISRSLILETEKQLRSPVENDLQFTFKHVLIRDVVYGHLPRMRRTQEHAHIALWLEEQIGKIEDNPTFVEYLAHHYQQAFRSWATGLYIDRMDITSSQRNERHLYQISREDLRNNAVNYLTLAGNYAMHSYHTTRAIQAYNDALELLLQGKPEATQQLCGMYVHLGDAYAQQGALNDSWGNYENALILLKDASPKDKMQLLFIYERMASQGTRWQGMFSTVPTPEETKHYIDAGLELLEDKPLSKEKIAFLTYRLFWLNQRVVEASSEAKIELVEQILSNGHQALSMAEELNEPMALSMVLDALGNIYHKHGQYIDSLTTQLRRLELEQLITDREELTDVYFSLGVCYAHVSEYTKALHWLGRGWNQIRTMESPDLLLSCLTWRMRVWRSWNRWDSAIEVAQDLIKQTERLQRRDYDQLWAFETLMAISYRRGNYEESEQYQCQHRRLLDHLISDHHFPLLKINPTQYVLENWQEAKEEYLQKLHQSEPWPSPKILAVLADLFVVTNEELEVQMEMCERAIDICRQSGAKKSLAFALRARGKMYLHEGNWQLAENDFRASLTIYEHIDLPWELGHTYYQIGLLHKQHAQLFAEQREANLGRSRLYLEKAIGYFESLQALPMIQKVRDELNPLVTEVPSK